MKKIQINIHSTITENFLCGCCNYISEKQCPVPLPVTLMLFDLNEGS
jgi:hypothetical protein